MSKISYQWYPAQWKASQMVWSMNLAERGLYRELLDLAYENNNHVVINVRTYSRYLRVRPYRFFALIEVLVEKNALKLHEVTSDKQQLVLSLCTVDARLKALNKKKEDFPFNKVNKSKLNKTQSNANNNFNLNKKAAYARVKTPSEILLEQKEIDFIKDKYKIMKADAKKKRAEREGRDLHNDQEHVSQNTG